MPSPPIYTKQRIKKLFKIFPVFLLQWITCVTETLMFICTIHYNVLLTLILLTWNIGWATNNARKWQMGFNSAFKGLNMWWIFIKFRSVALYVCWIYAAPSYTQSNKNPSAWNFLSAELEVMWRTVAIIIRVVLLPHICAFVVFLCLTIHYNQSHRVYINRRQQ